MCVWQISLSMFFDIMLIWKSCLVEITLPVRLRPRRQEAVATTLTQLARDGHAVLAPWHNPCFATLFDWHMKMPEPERFIDVDR